MNAKEFYELLQAHDWFYEMSDDSRAFNKGSTEKDYINKQIRANPDLKPIYDAYAQHRRTGEPLSDEIAALLK